MRESRASIWDLSLVVVLWSGAAAAEPSVLEAKAISPLIEKARLAESQRLQEREEFSLVGRGVVVESVGKGSALEKAGLQPEDVLYQWHRLPNPPANPDEANGELKSPFDWWDIRMEQGPRGLIELTGKRQDKSMVWKVGFGDWTADVRPNWLAELLFLYRQGQADIRSGAVGKGVRLWLQLAERLREAQYRAEHFWIIHAVATAHAEAREYAAADLIVKEWSITAPSGVAQVFALNGLGSAALKLQNLNLATYYFTQAENLAAAQMRSSLKHSALLFNQGLVASARGDQASAEVFLVQSLQIQQAQAPGGVGEARVLGSLGVLKRRQGYLAEASEYLQRSLKLQELQNPGTVNLSDALNNLGNVALQRGDLDLAEVYYERAFTMQEALDDRVGSISKATILSNLGIVAQLQGDLARSESLHRRALAIQKLFLPGSLDIARTLTNLGVLFEAKGDLAQAVDFAQSALQIKEQMAPESLEVALALTNLAILSRRSKKHSQAAELHERALQIRARLAPETAFSDLVDLIRLARDRGELDRAASYSRRAIEISEVQLEHLGSSRETEALFRSHNEYTAYREILSLQVELNHPETAFNFLERSRAQSYLAMLAERELVFSDLPSELDSKRRRLSVQYDRTLQSLRGLVPVKNEAQIRKIQGELVTIRQQQQDIKADIRTRFPRLAAIQYPQPLDIAAVRKVLDPGTVLLAYSVGEKETILFIVSGSGLSVEKLTVSEAELHQRVNEFRNLLDSAAGISSLGNLRAPRLHRLGRELYRLLVQPAEANLATGQRLLLLADGPLHLLPFAALQRSEGQYFGVWRPVHTALSATVWAELKLTRMAAVGSSASPTFSLAAFGDPLYPRFQTAEAKTSAGGSKAALSVPIDFRVRAAMETGLFDWSPLPGTRREVQQIAELFPEGSVRTYLGQEATEETAKAVGRKPRILHFAVHGHLDARFPWNSALAFSIPENPPEGRDNGLLQVWEILEGVRFDADLVVLSACETGLGEEQGGEGLIGLTRAFQYAGARSVLASLWNVQDQATSELMIRFYKHLRAGLPKDQALQAAQQELIRGPIEVINEKGERELRDFSSPYYWAGFQLYGDWQ